MKYYCILLLCTIQMQAQEFIYPVATFFDDTIAIMYQRSAQVVELYRGNVAENTIIPGMYSRFMPSYIQVLPGGAGFSFIDNGVIRIKLFYKRSPKTLEMCHPIYDINSLAWDTPLRLYVSAKHREQYALFQIDVNSAQYYLLSQHAVDFLYPQKVGTALFFVSRSKNNGQATYTVSVFEVKEDCEFDPENHKTLENQADKATRRAISSDSVFDAESTLYYDTNAIKTIIDFQEQPIAFLSMETEKTGFIVAHAPSLSSRFADGALFSYYHIYNDMQGWHTHKLFDFKVPLEFLAPEGACRLYEYMIPLLPKKIDNYLYYAHSDKGNLNLFKYALDTGETTQLTYAKQPNEHYFGIVQVDSCLYCGGSMRGALGDEVPLTRLEIK